MAYRYARYKYYKDGKPIYFYTKYISTIDIPYAKYELVENIDWNIYKPNYNISTSLIDRRYRK